MKDNHALSTLLAFVHFWLQISSAAHQPDVCQQFFCPAGLRCVAWEITCSNPPCWKIPSCQALWTASDSQDGQCPSYWSECSNEAGFHCQTDQDCAFNMKCCASHKCGKICVFPPNTRYKFPAYLWPSFLKDPSTDIRYGRPGQLQPNVDRKQCPMFWNECSNSAGVNCHTDQDCRFGMICCESHKCGTICVLPVNRFGHRFLGNGGEMLPHSQSKIKQDTKLETKK